eukprot:78379_1
MSSWSLLNSTQRRNLQRLGIGANNWTILIGNNMLNDVHINAANSLFKKQFPLVRGFFKPEEGVARDYPWKITERGATIHHVVTSQHYILSTLTNDEIEILDSLGEHNSVPIQNQIAMVYSRIGQRAIWYTFKECQKQTGSIACGLFCIARGYCFCTGKDPSTVFFDQRKMLPHFCQCLTNGVITAFPEISNNNNNILMTYVQKGHFLGLLSCCWLPSMFSLEGTIKCSKCKKIYHRSCYGMNRFTNIQNLIEFVC